MVLAAHFTEVRCGITTTLETVRFQPPERIDFRLVRGPVPHLSESFHLTPSDARVVLSANRASPLTTGNPALGAGLRPPAVHARWLRLSKNRGAKAARSHHRLFPARTRVATHRRPVNASAPKRHTIRRTWSRETKTRSAARAFRGHARECENGPRSTL
jgi:hypothetical protein